jgi:outer membrane protein TolC
MDRLRLLIGIFFFLIFFASEVPAQSGQLSIEDALRTALERNERTKASQERVDAAKSAVSHARRQFLPTLDVIGSYTRRAFETKRQVGSDVITIQSLNALSATANANMPLLDPRLFSTLAQARHERDATSFDAAASDRALKYEVCEAFLAALSAQRVAAAAARRLELAQLNLDAARATYEAQLKGSNDVTRAELEFATARRELTQSQGDLATARLQLEFVMNKQVQDTLASPMRLFDRASKSEIDVNALMSFARDKRSELLAGRARLEGIQAAATEALMRVFPALSLTAQYKITNEAGFSGKNTNWYAGANLTWSLFDGGIWMADRSENLALARASEYTLHESERKVAVDIQSAVEALRIAKATLVQSETALSVARTNSVESSARYREGLGTALEAADANVRLFEAEVALVRDQYALMIAWLGLRSAAGLDPLDKDDVE